MNNLIKKKYLVLSMILMMATGLFSTSTTVFAASGDTVVYITKTGECYHTSGCSSLKKSKIETTLEIAVAKGLRPCTKCNPGTLDEASNDKENSKATSDVKNSKSSKASTSTTKSKKSDTTSKSTANASKSDTSKTEYSYVANTSTKKFHKSTCASVSKIKSENRLDYTGTREELISEGYDPCKKCNP